MRRYARCRYSCAVLWPRIHTWLGILPMQDLDLPIFFTVPETNVDKKMTEPRCQRWIGLSALTRPGCLYSRIASVSFLNPCGPKSIKEKLKSRGRGQQGLGAELSQAVS